MHLGHLGQPTCCSCDINIYDLHPHFPPIKLMAHPHMLGHDAAQRRVLTHDPHVATPHPPQWISPGFHTLFKVKRKFDMGAGIKPGFGDFCDVKRGCWGLEGRRVVQVGNNRLGL